MDVAASIGAQNVLLCDSIILLAEVKLSLASSMAQCRSEVSRHLRGESILALRPILQRPVSQVIKSPLFIQFDIAFS